MRMNSYLKKIEALPRAGLEMLGSGGITILAPHPDDEALGTGGLIAACVDAGRSVNVVVLTDGAGSHPNSRRFPKQRLIELRKEECRNGLSELGLAPADISHFDLPDTSAPKFGPEFDKAIARLAEAIRRNASTSLFVTWDKDPHCDHFAAARMAQAVGKAMPELLVWHYPIWGWYLPRSKHINRPAPVGFSFDVAPWLGKKRAAIAHHASQVSALIDDDPDGFTFEPGKLARFHRPTEYFILRQA
jgi:LmbE family N-acetylglucosaminyl deacetylase